MWALDAVDRFRRGAEAAGLVNAVTINRISRPIGGGAALVINRWLTGHPVPAAAAASYYMVLQVLVTGAARIWLFGSGHPSYRRHRDALVVTGVPAVARAAADARAAGSWSPTMLVSVLSCQASPPAGAASRHPAIVPVGRTAGRAPGSAATARSPPDPGRVPPPALYPPRVTTSHPAGGEPGSVAKARTPSWRRATRLREIP